MTELSAPPERILIVRTSALGDVAHTLPSLTALRKLFPEAEIDWLVEPLSADLLREHPDLNEVHVLPRKDWSRRARRPGQWPRLVSEIVAVIARVRARRFDLVIDFQGNLRTAAAVLLCGGRYRLGFHRRNVAETGASWVTNVSMPVLPEGMSKVEKNLALVRRLGFDGETPRGEIAVDPARIRWAREQLTERNEHLRARRGPVVILHPGVSKFGDFKRWPTWHFNTLLRLLRERNDARVTVTWGPGEEHLAKAAAADEPDAEPGGEGAAFPSLTNIKDFIALIAAADVLVVADTGALPVAAILGTATVGLYGPKDWRVYAPQPESGEIVASHAPCSPCVLRACDHRICMELITPEEVYAATLRALRNVSVAT